MSSTIQERLKEVRNILKLSQKDISDKIGIARTYWTSLENGHREITAKILMSLIVTYDISSDWLLTGKNKMFLTGADPNDHEFERLVNNFYMQLVWIVELTEKLTGTNPEYDVYLDQIRTIIKSTENIKNKLVRRLTFEKLSNALLADFLSLFEDYFKMLNQSERTRKYNAHVFEPPRNFIKIELEK
jgi:transcriptional regulator with XRE-family HTH domain